MTSRRSLKNLALLIAVLAVPLESVPALWAGAPIDSSQPSIEQAAARFRQGELKAAEDAARKAIHQHPSSPEAHHLLGQILFNARKLQEALEAFSYAAKLRPTYAEVLNHLAGRLCGPG